MEYAIALISVICASIVGCVLLARLHPPTSSMDFANLDAYVDHLEKRDRFIQEEHMGLSALNTIIAVALASWYAGTAGQVLLPAIAMALGTFLTWCVIRVVAGESPEMIRWGGGDMSRLGFSFLIGTAAAVAVCVALSLSLFGLWSVPLFALAWLLLFPL